MKKSIPLEDFLHRLQVEFPESRAEVGPWSVPGEPEIEHFITLRDLPRDTGGDPSMRAFAIAREVYGSASLPFLMAGYFTEAKCPDSDPNRMNGAVDKGLH